MKTLFRTKVVSGKGATQHRLGIGETRRPEIVQLTICEGSGGIFLLYEDDQGSVFDTWHETVDQAKSQAAH
ncbi:MAG TPA: hypothetical protein VIV58_33035, partial [Kofleriaceae bacterium]